MTTLMKGFIRSRRLDKAIQLYESMKATNSQVKPDMITHSMLIKAHCDSHDMGTALKILEDMLESECTVDDVVFTHLIEGCCQVNNVRLAEKLFSDMRTANINPSIYTLNGLVKVYGKCGMSEKALDLVERMEEDYGIKPTVVVFTCLVSGLIRQKKHLDAWKTFKRMGEILRPDNQSTQTMLVGLADGQLWKEFVELAEQAVQNYKPTQERYNPPPGDVGAAERCAGVPELRAVGDAEPEQGDERSAALRAHGEAGDRGDGAVGSPPAQPRGLDVRGRSGFFSSCRSRI
jgi:pentatricopeptide repeat protein